MNSKEDLKNEIMPKFDRIYEEIMNDVNKSLPNAFDINTISELSTPRYRWFNTYELLNEYVEDNDKSLRCSKTLPGNGYGIYMKNKEFFDNDFAYALIGYFIYKNILPERQIDEKLNQHFKTFKYKDN